MKPYIKILEYALIFSAWGALVILGDTQKPGAQAFIMALVALLSGRTTYHAINALNSETKP